MTTLICKCFAFVLVITLPIFQKKDNKEKLLGVWGTDLNENANFAIGKDSMYYVDANESVKYFIKENPGGKDSIIIDYGGYLYRGVFWFRNDSLIIRDKRSENKFVRIK